MIKNFRYLNEAIFDLDDDVAQQENVEDFDDLVQKTNEFLYQEKLENIKKFLGIEPEYAKITISKNTLTIAYNYKSSTHYFFINKIKNLKTEFDVYINEIIFDTKYDYLYEYSPCQIFVYGDIEDVNIVVPLQANIKSINIEQCLHIINSNIIIPKLDLTINEQTSWKLTTPSFDIKNSKIRVKLFALYAIGEIKAFYDNTFIEANCMKVLYHDMKLFKNVKLIHLLTLCRFISDEFNGLRKDGDIEKFNIIDKPSNYCGFNAQSEICRLIIGVGNQISGFCSIIFDEFEQISNYKYKNDIWIKIPNNIYDYCFKYSKIFD